VRLSLFLINGILTSYVSCYVRMTLQHHRYGKGGRLALSTPLQLRVARYLTSAQKPVVKGAYSKVIQARLPLWTPFWLSVTNVIKELAVRRVYKRAYLCRHPCDCAWRGTGRALPLALAPSQTRTGFRSHESWPKLLHDLHSISHKKIYLVNFRSVLKCLL
jgi:hypothetical protein